MEEQPLIFFFFLTEYQLKCINSKLELRLRSIIKNHQRTSFEGRWNLMKY